jgi:hypothetical protein
MANEEKNPNRAKPFVINIFCADGDPNGLRIINKSNWSGRGFVCPRSLISERRLDPKYKSDFDLPGIYVLIGNSDDDTIEENMGNAIEENMDNTIEENTNDTDEDQLPAIYIGEADPVGDRLLSHCSKDENWTWCAFFVGDHINKAHIQHLEASLLKIAKGSPTLNLVNIRDATFPNLSLQEKAVADGFLAEMLRIFPIIGLDIFQEIHPPKNLLYIILESKKINAFGYERGSEFIVLKDSTAILQGAAKIPRCVSRLRKKLYKEGILVPVENSNCMKFTQHYTFHTPARAAGVILGHPAARSSWEYGNGATLEKPQKELDSEKNIAIEDSK